MSFQDIFKSNFLDSVQSFSLLKISLSLTFWTVCSRFRCWTPRLRW